MFISRKYLHSRYFAVTLLVVVAYSNEVLLTPLNPVEKDLLLTMEEKNVLDEFRHQITPILTKPFMKSDLWLARWLRANNFNSAETMRSIRGYLKWRQRQSLDHILKENWSDMEEQLPTSHIYDTSGMETIRIELGKWNIRGIAFQGEGPRFLRYMRYLMERSTNQVFQQQQLGMNVTQWKLAINAESFNAIRHSCLLCIPLWLQFINDLGTHYSGWGKEIAVENPPISLAMVLKAFQPFLKGSTRESFKLHGVGRRGSPLMRSIQTSRVQDLYAGENLADDNYIVYV